MKGKGKWRWKETADRYETGGLYGYEQVRGTDRQQLNGKKEEGADARSGAARGDILLNRAGRLPDITGPDLTDPLLRDSGAICQSHTNTN